jgi:hypothetical protein
LARKSDREDEEKSIALHDPFIETPNLNVKGERRMKTSYAIKAMSAALLVVFSFAPVSTAQDKPADNLEILRKKIRADKKLVVASNMELTESEAKNFWPIYDQYQKDLQKINQRLANVLESYADDFLKKSINDDKAKKLINDALAIDREEASLKAKYAPKLSKALPMVKVVRYLQIENKIRAVVRYDIASGVPLMR